jgi:hypothetical protein
MTKLFIFGIGGTGSRVIKSLVMLLASGMKAANDFEIVPIIIDPHKDNEDLKRTVSVLSNYQKITQAAGFNNGFFGTKISTLQSLDPENKLSGTYTFKLKEVSNTKFRNYFSYDTLPDESKAFADLIFSGKTVDNYGSAIDLLDIPMDIGFVGNPNVGSVVLNQFKDSEEFKDFANNFNDGDRIFIISSIFGGTGAAGFPTILKNIRSALNLNGIANGGYLQKAPIGALTVLPYFNIEGDEDSPIKKSDFIEKTKAALKYYKDNVNTSLNAMYYLGDTYNGKPYENDPGHNGQKNKAHFVELAGGLAIFDFMDIPQSDLETANENQESTIFKEYGLKSNQTSLTFNDLGDYTNGRLYKSLTQLALFKKFIDEHFESSVGRKAWSVEAPALDTSFTSKTFFNSNVRGFLSAYKEWLSELETNSRGFSPFNLNGELDTFISTKPAKKGLFGIKSWHYDSYDVELSKTARRGSYHSAEEKLLKLFFDTTENIVTTKY